MTEQPDDIPFLPRMNARGEVVHQAIEVPYGVAAILVPPPGIPVRALRDISDIIDRTIAEAPAGKPVVIIMAEPGWEVHVLPSTRETEGDGR